MAKRKRSRTATLERAPISDPPVRPGLVGPRRRVPRHIPRPPYARTGEPGPAVSAPVRSAAEIAAMRRAGQMAAEVLLFAGRLVAPGVTTERIDAEVHEEIVRRGAYPSPLNYRGYPKSVCTSVNEVICHGIPDSRPLADGDIVNIDVTVYLDGVHGDTSVTFEVGEVDDHSRLLVRETRAAMYLGIEAVRDGAPVCAIGQAIETHARTHRLGVVREFIGHGVGTEFHSGLQIPHYYDRRHTTPLTTGMSFTIEPMLTLGAPDLYVWDDQWTAVTADQRRSAQFEHTLLCTGDGMEIFTRTPSGEGAAEVYARD
ncbi:type I methionyl aminopeptidase [Candidatus Poriferisocius sp.]|uniref:type I methionyl aminopeptidase n=1 Tax=Candidatus Poriferisocius sp. TaxID=3101276 RepID=UPI003B599E30